MPALPHLSADQIFAGKYRVVRLIKSGGMGAVYEVRHTVNEKRWALKIMKPELTGDAEARERFEREAKIDTLIESTFVVSVIDAGIDEATETPYLVMEYLVGEELGARINRVGPMPPADVVRLLAQVARALDKAHDRKIVHRDLKPDNLFIVTTSEDDEGSSSGTGEKMKILDFGIAKIIAGAAHEASSTGGGGTPMYMAPEQTRRTRDIGPWTDVWALGLIAYSMLVGRPFWEGEALGEIIREIIDDGPREAPSSRARRLAHRRVIELPPAFDAWFLRCVENQPEKRFARAGEAIARLGDVFGIKANVAVSAAIGGMGVGAEPVPSPLAETMPAPDAPDALRTTSPVLMESPPPTPTPVAPSPAPQQPRRLLALGLGASGLVVATLVAAKLFSSSSSSSGAIAPSDLRTSIERENPFLQAGSITLQKTEVTRGQYALYLASLPNVTTARPLREWPGEQAREHQPVTWITWTRATHFCEAIGARLPTVAEWKAAAAFPWGEAWPPPHLAEISVARGGASHSPRDVMSAPADRTAATAHSDLFGNVAEWTSTTSSATGGVVATVIGAAIDSSVTESKDLFLTGVQKMTDEGSDADAHAEELADALVGFRCAR